MRNPLENALNCGLTLKFCGGGEAGVGRQHETIGVRTIALCNMHKTKGLGNTRRRGTSHRREREPHQNVVDIQLHKLAAILFCDVDIVAAGLELHSCHLGGSAEQGMPHRDHQHVGTLVCWVADDHRRGSSRGKQRCRTTPKAV